MNEIFLLKSVISEVWVCLLFKKIMTEMSPVICWNTVTSFVYTEFFFLPLYFLIFYCLSQLLTHCIFSLIVSLEEIYPLFQACVQLMYFHSLGGKSNVLIFKLFFDINFRFSPCIIIVNHFYCPTNALNYTKLRG